MMQGTVHEKVVIAAQAAIQLFIENAGRVAIPFSNIVRDLIRLQSTIAADSMHVMDPRLREGDRK
jgi:hypothetical protein